MSLVSAGDIDRLRDEIIALKIERDHWKQVAECQDQAFKLKVGNMLAFLDGVAKRMWVRGEQKSAEDCRAMAARLRGETWTPTPSC